MDDAVRQEAAEHEAALAAHRHDPVDPSWAAHAQSALEGDLEALAGKLAYQVVDVDCRTTTCAATLEWPSRAAAAASSRELVAARYQMSCATALQLPLPDGASSTYRATILYDCASDRANGRSPAP